MAEKTKRYIVAPGCSFVGNKKTYKEGDEIDESAFNDKDRFKKFFESKPPKIIEALAVEKKKEPKKLERKELEKLVIEHNLLKKEQLASTKDDELEALLKGNGVLN